MDKTAAKVHMDTKQPVTIQRRDYQPFEWQVVATHLHFDLHASATRVRSELKLRRQPAKDSQDRTLVLDGVDIALESIYLDGEPLPENRFHITASALIIQQLPDQCTLCINTLINPQGNTALEGLYRSGNLFCTQCEAEGFRKITYYPDRPDVLSVFDVSIEADIEHCPTMLCNGAPVSQEVLENGRHRIQWHDPHPKPCYLFALVAGRLSVIEDHFTTASGRSVLLQIYVESHNSERCEFAMLALKKSMRWDEQVYGFEYDLERFMIVAVDDFNMGAMENKGLNIFNSRYVLADKQTATDTDFIGIESVIAHEYFHNWTGNRITCRDWFQLSLKEGLTVFRDQCFSADQHSSVVKRIEDVRLLRARQFPEDAGPMAHPIRPESYIEINNFYTLTVYEKGAEVIRMLHTLLGEADWRKGMDVYVERHDGSATTCDAFIDAMQSVTDSDLEQFRRWYSTAGTPELEVVEHYDECSREYRLELTQRIPDTPGQSHKLPLHIPMVLGLMDSHGKSITINQGRPADEPHSAIFDLREYSQTLVFPNLDAKPVPSLLRGFSAPVKLQHGVDNSSLAFLMCHDTDAFNRWEAGQRLSQRVILSMLDSQGRFVEDNLNRDALEKLLDALDKVLGDDSLDLAFRAEMLLMPTPQTLANALTMVDYQALDKARRKVLVCMAREFEAPLLELVQSGRDVSLAMLDDRAMGMRKLANTALVLIGHLQATLWEPLAVEQFKLNANMTDRLAALTCLCNGEGETREQALNEFYLAAKGNRLVVDKWFAVQAMSSRTQIVDDVLALYKHPDFEVANPNRLRSLVASFAMNNPVGFHSSDGRGYAFVADQVLALNARNPQLAAGLVAPLTHWRIMVRESAGMMQDQLARISACDSLSSDVYELVSKSLA